MTRFALPTVLVSVLAFGACGESPTAVPESPGDRRSALRADLIPAADDPVFVGAGDMHADCLGTGEGTTAALLDGIGGTVFTLGDNAEHGTTSDFNNCYEPTWGRHKTRTRPIPGDNDHLVAGAGPYFAYFGDNAGPAGRGYYSHDLGAWHIIALDSNIPSNTSSAQYQWLQADLAANPTDCALAYWHHARFSSTRPTVDTRMNTQVWTLLDREGVEVVLSGHYHSYERFAPQDAQANAKPNGIREFVVGTGGKGNPGPFDAIRANSEVRYNGSLGVLKLTLHATSYDWEFVPEAGQSYSDSGSGSCH